MSFVYLDTGVIVYLFVIAGILGAVFGSFVTCQAERIAAKENWVSGHSHCDVCGHELGVVDLIPIVSYVVHGGRCRYCHAKLSSKYVWTEVLMALAFMGVLWHVWALSMEVVMDWGLVTVLLGLSIVDMKTYEIPNGYIVFGIVWWALCIGMELVCGMDVIERAVQGLIGGTALALGMLVLSLIMDHILKKESLGGGDIKLLFVVGLYTGVLNGLFVLIAACVIGLVFVFVMKKDKIPFGPAISIAAYMGLTVLPYVTGWYISLF